MPLILVNALRHWKLIGIGILIAALVVQSLRLDSAQERAKRYKGELATLEQRLKDETQRQREVTKDTIIKANDGMKRSEPIARRIENAPITGDCRTPPAVLEADL